MILIRRVVGDSMLPTLQAGQLIVAHRLLCQPKPGDAVIVRHDGREKIKRIARVDDGRVFVLGDNSAASTDSRDFGWLQSYDVIAKVLWARAGKVK